MHKLQGKRKMPRIPPCAGAAPADGCYDPGPPPQGLSRGLWPLNSSWGGGGGGGAQPHKRWGQPGAHLETEGYGGWGRRRCVPRLQEGWGVVGGGGGGRGGGGGPSRPPGRALQRAPSCGELTAISSAVIKQIGMCEGSGAGGVLGTCGAPTSACVHQCALTPVCAR